MKFRKFVLMDTAPGDTGSTGGGAPAPAPALGGGAPAPAPSVPGALGGGAPAPAPAPAPEEWYSGVQNEAARDWAKAKGWKDVPSAIESAYNMEKLFGFDKAGRTVVLPKDEGDVEGLKAFRAKMGVPETADGYKLPVPEGTPPEFSKQAAAWFHEQGVPQKAAEAIAAKWNEYAAGGAEAIKANTAKQADAARDSVYGEWGAAKAQNEQLMERAFAAIVPAEITLDNGEKLARADLIPLLNQAGLRGFAMKHFADLGKTTGEHSFVPSGGGGDGAILTPAEAKAKIAGLQSDPEWRKAYVAGDKTKSAELQRLNAFAYPPEPDAVNPFDPTTWQARR